MKKWFGLAAVLLCIALLLLALIGMGRGFLLILNGAEDSGERDPMFAPEAELDSQFTRPPELTDESRQAEALPEDSSDTWIYGETAPVDKTAEALGRELNSPT